MSNEWNNMLVRKENYKNVLAIAKTFNRFEYETLEIFKYCLDENISLYMAIDEFIAIRLFSYCTVCRAIGKKLILVILKYIAFKEGVSISAVAENISIDSLIPYVREFNGMSNKRILTFLNGDAEVERIDKYKAIIGENIDLFNKISDGNEILIKFKGDIKNSGSILELEHQNFWKLNNQKVQEYLSDCENLRKFNRELSCLFVLAEDANRFIHSDVFARFNNWLSIKSLKFYCAAQYWTCEQATCLLLGIDPQYSVKKNVFYSNGQLASCDILDFSKIEAFPFCEDLIRLNDILKTWGSSLEPIKWYRLAIEKNIFLCDLLHTYFSKPEVNIVDSTRDQASVKIDNANPVQQNSFPIEAQELLSKDTSARNKRWNERCIELKNNDPTLTKKQISKKIFESMQEIINANGLSINPPDLATIERSLGCYKDIKKGKSPS